MTSTHKFVTITCLTLCLILGSQNIFSANGPPYLTTFFFQVKSTQVFAPKLRIVNSSKVPDCNPLLNFPYKIKPDISAYPINSDPRVVTNSSKVEMFLEFKWNINDSPFCEVYDVAHPNAKASETVKSFLRNTKAAKDTLGQITAYAAAQFGAQFRTHIYSILIIKDTGYFNGTDQAHL